MQHLKEISKILAEIKNSDEIEQFLKEVLTQSEIATLSKRWRILNMLFNGVTQREIAKELNVSLCKVTRGAKIVKDKNAIVTKYLIKEKNNDKYTITNI